MEIEKTTATIKEYIQSKGIDLMSFEIEEIASVITRFDRDIQLKILKKADLTSKDYIYSYAEHNSTVYICTQKI